MPLQIAKPARKKKRPAGSPRLIRTLIVLPVMNEYITRYAVKWYSRKPRDWSPQRVVEMNQKKKVIFDVIEEMVHNLTHFTVEDVCRRIIATGKLPPKFNETLSISVGNAFQEFIKSGWIAVDMLPAGEGPTNPPEDYIMMREMQLQQAADERWAAGERRRDAARNQK